MPPKSKKKGYKVLIVAKQNKAGIKAAKELEKMLLRHTKDVDVDKSTAFKLARMGTQIGSFKGDFIISVGGDGTFLMTAHRTTIPILPVRIEGKGFLCTTDYKDLKKHLPSLFKGKYKVVDRVRLKCTKVSTDPLSSILDRIHHKDYPLSINEVAFARKRPSKLLEIEMKINDTTFNVTGDGIMFFTPHGSTAYSASAGGPIIDTSIGAIGVVPLYPFYSKIKPFVVPADRKIEVTVKGGDCALVIDGHGGDFFKADSKFVIERAKPAKVITFEDENFYQKLKERLLT